MKTKVDFLAIGDLGIGESARFDGSGAVFEGRVWKSARPACAGRLVASSVVELLAEMIVA